MAKVPKLPKMPKLPKLSGTGQTAFQRAKNPTIKTQQPYREGTKTVTPRKPRWY